MTMFKKATIASLMSMSLMGCASDAVMTDAEVAKKMANNLNMHYQLVTNNGANEGLECQNLGAEWGSCDLINMTLTNEGEAIDSKDWKIYFHSIRQILDVQNDQFKVTHVTGDLHTLEPTDNFEGFKKGEKVVIPYVGEYWTLFEGDYMPRAYVIAGESQPETLKSTDTENASDLVDPIDGEKWKRVPEDNNVLATAKSRFEKNKDVQLMAEEEIAGTIMPTPLRTTMTGSTVDLSQGILINNNALPKGMLDAVNTRLQTLDVNTQGTFPVSLNINPRQFDGEMKISGAYYLDVTPTGINIVGYDVQGAFYGMQSVMSLMSKGEAHKIPTIKVEDAPRFEYRGVMVDVGRNFHSKEAMLRTIDQMAAYKMNKFHFHLTDDEGWRLEIPGLPELTEVGGQRCHDETETQCLMPQLGSGPDSNNFGSGFYTKADYLEILTYAKNRGVEIIPEFDMPAHSRAAVVSMEARYKKFEALGDMEKANEYRLMDPNDTSNVTTVQFYDKKSFVNPCMDSSERFVDKVISEVVAMHKEAGMPLNTWHFGGDEAKNIKLGGGFQDKAATDAVAWKGSIDQSKEDRPFEQSPMCQTLVKDGTVSGFDQLPSYFAEKVSEVVAKHGINNFQAWQDGLKYSKGASEFATDNVRVNFWDVLYWGGGASAYEWAQKGYDVIVSNPDYVYMDMPYEVDPKEKGYYWATRATDTRKMFGFAPENLPQNAETSVDRDGNGFKSAGTVAPEKGIYGLSAQLWSESVRTDDQFEYMVYPRVLAAAERAWHKADWENDYKVGVEYSADTSLVDKGELVNEWTQFANVLGQRELAKLDAAGIQYRVPVPGAVIENGVLDMNVSFPGLTLQYSTDGEKTWQNFDANNKPTVSGEVWVRAVSADGQRFSRAITL